MGGDSRVAIVEYLPCTGWHVPCLEWLTLCCPFAISMVVQMPNSHVITYCIELCCKRKLFKVRLSVLVTLNMLKMHMADNTSTWILDVVVMQSAVWVLALGNHIANGDSIRDRTRTVHECFEITSNFNRMEDASLSR